MKVPGMVIGQRLEVAAARRSPAVIRGLSPDFMDWDYLSGIFRALPQKFRAPVADTYRKKREKAGQQAANVWAGEVGKVVTVKGAALASSDAEICERAAAAAREVSGLLADSVATTAEAVAGRLVRYCEKQGIEAPAIGEGGMTLAGLVGRMTDAAWWRRQLRRSVGRKVEAAAIGIGLVHRFAGLYASDETVKQHAEQCRRNAAALENTEAENEEGAVFTLAELSAKGVSNPAIRRAELMTRIRGFEDYAKEAGHVGRFYTWTAPSRMHARLSRSGQENPKFDGTTPREAAGFLCRQFAKLRAWWQRRGLYPYGFRVAEPHHDGTPHWHLLLFMPPEVAGEVSKGMAQYAMEPDSHELTSEAAAAARFKVVAIDWERGSAAGYIAKYIAKNIDGKKATGEAVEFAKDEADDCEGGAVEGAARVRAWASRWGIRQFQQIGGPGVTVWRELRRLRDVPEQGELFPLWGTADKGVWHGYIREMGGVEVKRADRPAQLWREALPGKRNRYGEEAAPEICGFLLHGVGFETRVHRWEIRRAGNGRAEGKQRGAFVGASRSASVPVCGVFRPAALVGAEGIAGRVCGATDGAGPGPVGFDVQAGRVADGPWTRVNNCTPSVDADGFKIGAPLPAPSGVPVDTAPIVKAAMRAAVLANIASRRMRGAFGQFPQLRE